MALLISLEFLASATRSGNGVFARTVAQGLCTTAPVFVLTAQPTEDSAKDAPVVEDDAVAGIDILPVPVPAALWGRLGRLSLMSLSWLLAHMVAMIDYFSAWREFASGSAADRVLRRVLTWPLTHIVVVDWTGHAGPAHG